MLTAFVLVISAVVGFFSLDAMTGIWPYITAGILTLMAFGCPLAVFFICRGIGTVSRLGLRRAGGRELGLAAAATAVLILQNAILKLGIFRGAYDGVTYELFGSPFSGNVTSVWELLAALVTLVLLPATAEELFFCFYGSRFFPIFCVLVRGTSAFYRFFFDRQPFLFNSGACDL